MFLNRSTVHETRDDLLQRLTVAAYEVALKHGIKGSFLDLELKLWHTLAGVIDQGTIAPKETQQWPV